MPDLCRQGHHDLTFNQALQVFNHRVVVEYLLKVGVQPLTYWLNTILFNHCVQTLFNLFNYCSTQTSQFNMRFLYVIKYFWFLTTYH